MLSCFATIPMGLGCIPQCHHWWTLEVKDGLNSHVKRERLELACQYIICLVGGLVAMNFIFPFILGMSNHPNWRTHIFQRGGPGPPTRYVYTISRSTSLRCNKPMPLAFRSKAVVARHLSFAPSDSGGAERSVVCQSFHDDFPMTSHSHHICLVAKLYIVLSIYTCMYV